MAKTTSFQAVLRKKYNRLAPCERTTEEAELHSNKW